MPSCFSKHIDISASIETTPPPAHSHTQTYSGESHTEENLQEERHHHGKPIDQVAVRDGDALLVLVCGQDDDHADNPSQECHGVEATVGIKETRPIFDDFEIPLMDVGLYGCVCVCVCVLVCLYMYLYQHGSPLSSEP